jgi:hypothetical protein
LKKAKKRHVLRKEKLCVIMFGITCNKRRKQIMIGDNIKIIETETGTITYINGIEVK